MIRISTGMTGCRPFSARGWQWGLRFAVLLLFPALGWGQDLQISGKILFWSSRDGNLETYAMNADGSNQTRLTNNGAEDYGESWSPDGTKISFSTNRDGNFEIYSMNADGTGVTRLTSNGASENQSAWSPDGAKIAFFTNRDGGNSEIYVMNADGTSQTRLTTDPGVEQVPSWSPDGTKIAFISTRDGNAEVYVMNADGTSQTRLTNNSASDSYAYWSPDGTKIAFQSNRDGNEEIYVMNADGTGQTRLTNNPAGEQVPSWSPDGTKIAFRSTRNDSGEIYIISTDGTGETRLTNNGVEDYSPVWAIPQRIGATTLGSSVSRAMTIENKGALPLVVTSITSLDGQFTMSPTAFTVPSAGSQNVTVTFTPTSAGTKYSTLTILSNDLDAPTAKLTVNGTATAAPVPVFSFSTGSLAGNTKVAFRTDRDGNNEVYVMNTDGTNQTRLTNNSANDENFSWSPDGTKIAFNSNRDGNDEIYVMNADGTNQTRLTNSALSDDVPVWSPDGTKIAFRSSRDGNAEIYVMNADGTNQTRLTSNSAGDYSPSWSPDGTKITFWSDRDGNPEIYVMNADGTSQTRLTNNSASDNTPFWSSDGTKISFVSERDGNNEIYVMNTDGTNQTRLTNNSAHDFPRSWSPDGTKIIFESNRGGRYQTYTMNADGTNQSQVTNASWENAFPSWSPFLRTLNLGTVTKGTSGTTTFTVTNRGNATLSVTGISVSGTDAAQFSASPTSFSLAAGASQTVTVTFAPTKVGWEQGTLSITHNASGSPATVTVSGIGRMNPPTGSLTNTRLAYWSYRDDNYEIYVMNSDGTNQTRLTNNLTTDAGPSWSPDGTKIVFESMRDGNVEIYIMNSDGTNQTRLTNNSAQDYSPSWSPDALKIVFGSDRDGNNEIYIMNSDGTNQSRLTNNSAVDGDPSWSPDGTKVTFHSMRDGNYEIYVMNSDGTNQTRLTNNSSSDSTPSWSPDGTKIAFVLNPGGNNDIYVMNSDGSNQIRLTSTSQTDSAPCWSPDGTKIAFVSDRDGNAEIYIMNSDGTNQIRLTSNSAQDNYPSWSPFITTPTITLSTTSVNVGTMNKGASGTATFTVTNSGGGTLSISNITSSNSQFSASPTNFNLAAGASQTVTVTFTPTSGTPQGTPQSGTLTLTHNAAPTATSSTVNVSGTGVDPAPAIPAALTATAGTNQVLLSWTANSEADLSHYVVYRSTTDNFAPTAADSIARVNKPTTTYTNTGLSAGTYYFKIAAVDSAGSKSGFSAQASAAPVTPGPTNASGTIAANTTWTVFGSPYIVTGNILVNNGVTLTIESGVTVKFDIGRAMQVNGTLIARGTPETKITFTSNKSGPASGDWSAITFADLSTDATYDGSGNYVSGSIIEQAVIEYGGAGGSGVIQAVSASPLIRSVTVRNNGAGVYISSGKAKIEASTVSNNAAYGIKIDGGGSVANFVGNTVTHNSGDGIAVVGWNETYGKVINNLVTDNSGNGITVTVGAARDTLQENTVVRNSGWGIYINGDVTVTQNRIISNRGGGLFMDSSSEANYNLIADNSGRGYSASVFSPHLRFNAIIRNTGDYPVYYGAYNGTRDFSYNTIAYNKSTATTAPTVVFLHKGYAGVPRLIGNNILGNTATYLVNNDYANTVTIEGTNNWWGTSADAAIQAGIFDWFDDGARGIITYSPYLSAPETTAPTSPPANVTKTAVSGGVQLTWSPNPEGDIAGYKVYYGLSTGYSFASMVNVGRVTNYTLSGVSISDSVAVTAYDAQADGVNDQLEGHESWFTLANAADTAPPAVPGGLIATAGNNQVTLTWTANTESDLSHYVVYRNATNNFTPTLADSIARVNKPTTTFTNTGLNAGTYYFKIVAVDSANNKSSASGQATATLAPIYGQSANALSFGAVNIGSTGTQTFTVSNTGNAALNVTGITVSGTDAGQFSVSPTSFTVNAGAAAQTVTVTFTPTGSPGSRSASLSLAHNAAGSPSSVALSGTGVALAPVLSLSSTSLSFGSVNVGLSGQQPLKIKNTGTGLLSLTTLSTAPPFSSSAMGPLSINPGDSTTVTVTFMPTVGGAASGTLTITHNAAGSPSSVALSGTGVSVVPVISLSPAALSFGSVNVGLSGQQPLKIKNTGTGLLSVATLSTAAPFSSSAIGPLSINPGDSTTVTLTFTPTAGGAASGTLTITHNAAGSPSTVSLSGTGTAINAAPTIADIPNQTTDEDKPTAALSFKIKDLETAGSGLSLSKTSSNTVLVPADSIVFSGADTTRTVTVKPARNQSGSATITVTVSDGSLSVSDSFTLTVNPVNDPPVLSLIGPKSLNEGELLTFTLSGSDVDGDALTYTASALPAGASLSGTSFSWTPTYEQAGTYSVIFTVSDNKGGTASETVVLTVNNAIPPVWTPSPLTWNFGDVSANTRAERTFFLKNPGSVTARLDSLVSNNRAFTVVSPTFPRTVNGKDSLAVSVRFTPAPGVLTVQEGVLRIHSSLGQVNVPLAGRGVWVSFAVSPLELDFGRVRPNTSASRSLTVTNGGNLRLEVTATTISNPVFSLSPRSFSVEGGSSREVTVTFAPTQGRQEEGTLTLSGNADSTKAVRLKGQGGEGPSLVIVPPALNFGSVRVDSARVGLLRLKNGGGDTLKITALTGLEPPFSVSPTQVPPLLANDSTQVRVRFAPTAKGSFSDALLVTLNDGSQREVTVSGKGVRPEVSLPSRLDFGRVAVGSTGELNLVITNAGDDTLRVLSALSDKPAVFTVTGVLPLVVAPSAAQGLAVRFSPQTAGKDSSELTLSTNAGLPQRVRLAGTGEDAAVSEVVVRLVPAEFGSVPVGQQKTAQVVAINRSRRSVTIDSLKILPPELPMRIASGSLPRTLRSRDSVAVATVEFAPTRAGTFSGSLRVKGRGVEQTLTLSGTATQVAQQPPSLSYTPSDTLRFGVVGPNQSELQAVEIRNSGGSILKVVLRSEGDEFMPEVLDTIRVEAGQSYSALIRFRPARTGTRRANLLLSANDPQKPLASLVMQGSGGGLYFEPPSLVFGEVQGGGRKDTTVVLVNQTAGAITVRLSLPAGDFSVDRTSARIDAGKSLVLKLSFRPSRPGPRSARLGVQGRDLGLDLAGTGVEQATTPPAAGNLQLSTTSLVLGNTRVRSTSRKTLTLTNTGTQNTSVTLRLSGDNANQFRVSPTRLTLTPRQRRTVTVTFNPTSTGAKSATLTLTPSTGSPLTVALSGTATASRSLMAVEGVAKPVAQVPTVFALEPNYPNPFNAQTAINYHLPQAGQVRLSICDLLGQQVRTLVEGSQPAGYYQVLWDGRSDHGQPMASGVYIYRLESPGQTAHRRLLLLK